MDDSAILVEASSPEQLFVTLRSVLQLVRAVFRAFGFTANFKKGKTEVVARVVGRSASEVWHNTVERVQSCP
eukprot:11671062-Alexandrium_andersonii.AAC.1